MKTKNSKANPQAQMAVRCSAFGIVLFFLFGCLSDGLGEIPKLCHPPRSLMCAQTRCGYDVHKFDAINDESLERWNLLKLSCGVGKLLCQPRASLELSERDLQAKLAEMLPLFY